jgi:hypothetical protein
MTAIVDYTLQVFSGDRLLAEVPAHQAATMRQRQLGDLLGQHPEADRAVLRINGCDQEVYALRAGKVVAVPR